MSSSIACPRCRQDWLRHVRLIKLDKNAIICPECEALWFSEDAIGSRTWVDYGTYLRDAGRQNPDDRSELEVLGLVDAHSAGPD